VRFLGCRPTAIIASFALLGILGVAIATSVVARRASPSRSLTAAETATLRGGACPGCSEFEDWFACSQTDACVICQSAPAGTAPPLCAQLGSSPAGGMNYQALTGTGLFKSQNYQSVCYYDDLFCNSPQPFYNIDSDCANGDCVLGDSNCRACSQGQVGGDQ